MTSKLKTIILATVTAIAVPLAASAAPVTLEQAGANLFGDQGLSSDITIRFNSVDQDVGAGGFHVRETGGRAFIAWCVDLAESLTLPFTYDKTTSSPLTTAATDNLSRLFTGFADDIDTSVKSAAFQVAIWELISDTTFDLAAGDFQMLNNQAVADQANTYLTGLSMFNPDDTLTFFVAPGSQDVVTDNVPPVPLPASALLMLSGLGALAFRGRKRA